LAQKVPNRCFINALQRVGLYSKPIMAITTGMHFK